MMDGFLGVLKPPGMTSQDVVGLVRRLLPRKTKVGHGGTLDPDAGGVLPVCVGRATRLFDHVVDKQKTYIAGLRLGETTDTQDASGLVLNRRDASAVTDADIEAALGRFVGDIEQTPPMYSAIKRDGQRLYDLARKGQVVDIEPRRVHIDAAALLGHEEDGLYRLRVDCRKGVYIRTLCHDLGQALGVGGHMAYLVRARAGRFTLEDCVTVEEIARAAEAGQLEALIRPCDWPLEQFGAVRVDARFSKSALNGVPIPPELCDRQAEAGLPLRAYLDNRFLGMAAFDETGLLRVTTLMLIDQPKGGEA